VWPYLPFVTQARSRNRRKTGNGFTDEGDCYGSRHIEAADGFVGAAVLALAVCAYACALAVGGNGFIAAFIGGLTFGTASGRQGTPLVPFVEEASAQARPSRLRRVHAADRLTLPG